MSEHVLIHRQRTLLWELTRLVSERAKTEPVVEASFKVRNDTANRDHDEDYQAVISRFAQEKEITDKEYTDSRLSIAQRYEREQADTEKDYQDTKRASSARFLHDKTEVKTAFHENRWTIGAVFDGNKTEAEKQMRELQGRIAAGMQRIGAIQKEARELLREWRQHADEGAPLPTETNPEDQQPLGTLQQCIKAAEEQLEELKSQKAPRFFKGSGRFVVYFVFALLCGVALYFSLTPDVWYAKPAGGLGGTLGALVLAWAINLLLYSMARSQVLAVFQPLCETIVTADVLRQRCEAFAAASYKRQLAKLKKRHNREVLKAHKKYRKRRGEIKQRHADIVRQADEKRQRVKIDSTRRRDTDMRDIENAYHQDRAEIQQRFEADSRQIHERQEHRLKESKLRHETDWHLMMENWTQGLADVQTTVAEINLESKQLFPDWSHPAWQRWSPPTTLPPALRFGEYQVNLEQVLAEVPHDDRLKVATPASLVLPAFHAFGAKSSLLIQAHDEGRPEAVHVLQTMMFRMLTSYPPGKVRFTIIDPVGLGENFAAFMHLTDYDEQLVASRIWTELSHIEQRLIDLTAHMENVIQKYLRNQFQTIEEYNEHAGEVAEPFRILVVANFPVNFSVEAMRRLVSIVSSGARCGVYALITVDTRQPFMPGFSLADLEQHSSNLVWSKDRFQWREPDFGKYELSFDPPPPDDLCTHILHQVGEKAKDANRVEVPFEFIAPTPDQWWTCDSRYGINVPLGRAGATKRQPLQLGKGTSQHVLVAGKTGSGKSTLLHALIANLSLLYSPEEVELYLIDFKKGVEFKTYATHELPHARIIAIESEREFGLSVLQRLDAELKARGDRFRAVGAQDLAAYRDATNNSTLPRIMLIVDEFQEFFTEDDKIAQDAAQFLDRLVRQGRAFGLHVMLGSQTLGGAYTLARSTIDQMAVRIALQCSEADAHLILSDENSAARLLSRPGEAIYNDANGLIEGNNPFQVVWLPEERREDYLRSIQLLDRQRNQALTRPQIVFEGNAPADVGKNHLLNGLLLADHWPEAPRSFQAWLGEAMAIKDPTSAVFRRQSGSNLLMVGQQDESALAILSMALLSLAAQHTPGDEESAKNVRFYVLDGTPSDDAHAAYFAKLPGAVPHNLRLGRWRDLPALIDEIATEVERRQKELLTDAPTIYLLIFGLQRFRDLRKSEDDFGFTRPANEKPSPAAQFTTILREGSGFGVHTLVWCDTLNNVNRYFDRQSMREFEMRVLFQMSVADSSNLIDTPVASKLGLHRALFYSEEQGRMEKFRPYGLPAESWLAWVRKQLGSRQPAQVAVTV